MVDDSAKLKAPTCRGRPRLHLVYRFDERLFAIAVENVEEVVFLGTINEVPGAARDLLGLMNLRGEALPILDNEELFRRKAGAPDGSRVGAEPAARHLLILSSARGRFGLSVDKALKVSGLTPMPLPTEDLVTSDAGSAIQSYAMDGTETILILDPEVLSIRSVS